MSATKTDKEFREEQKKEAAKQGMTSDNAVPEKRPIASQQPNSSEEAELTKRQKADGVFDPMGKEAYDRAEKAPSAASVKKEQTESLRVGAKVRVIDEKHEHYGSAGAVQSVEYKDDREANKARSGDPAIARFAKVERILVRTRGGSHALINLSPDQVKTIRTLGVSSSVE